MTDARPPLAIDLCCGTGGWTAPFLMAGYRTIGFDIRRDHRYPGDLVLQDIRTVAGHQLTGATVILASPPCTEFSLANPMRTQRQKAPDLSIVLACARMATEAKAPLILENVHGLQRWLGPATHHYGKFYLWGNGVPALLPAGPRWKDKQKMKHRSPWLRGRIPEHLATFIAHYYLNLETTGAAATSSR